MEFKNKLCSNCGKGFQTKAPCQLFCSLKCQIDTRVERCLNNGCWIWKGATNKKGYGVVNYKDRVMFVHRAMYELYKGPIDYFLVCHHCDNPTCVNPNHLFLGTAMDNTRDMISKGRMAVGEAKNASRGEDRYNAKFTEWDIRFIRYWRSCGHTLQSIGNAFGTTRSVIGNIIYRRSWAHVGD